MKISGLALLLFISQAAFSQSDDPKQIVKKALQKMSGGKELRAFYLTTTGERSEKMAAKTNLDNPMMLSLKSMSKMLPDSIRDSVIVQMETFAKDYYDKLVTSVEQQQEKIFYDSKLRKLSLTTIYPDPASNRMDSSVSSYDLDDEMQKSAVAWAHRYCPIALLTFMSSDSVEINLTGMASIDGNENFLIQVKDKDGWNEALIDKKTSLLTRWTEYWHSEMTLSATQEKPGQTYQYFNYEEISGFLLPTALEQVSDVVGNGIRKRLKWANIVKK